MTFVAVGNGSESLGNNARLVAIIGFAQSEGRSFTLGVDSIDPNERPVSPFSVDFKNVSIVFLLIEGHLPLFAGFAGLNFSQLKFVGTLQFFSVTSHISNRLDELSPKDPFDALSIGRFEFKLI